MQITEFFHLFIAQINDIFSCARPANSSSPTIVSGGFMLPYAVNQRLSSLLLLLTPILSSQSVFLELGAAALSERMVFSRGRV